MHIDVFIPPSKYEALFVASIDGKNIGMAGLYRWIDSSWEFRINLLPEYQGKGYGSELTERVLKYGFEVLNLDRIWLGVETKNQPAVRVYEKAGFKPDGILRMRILKGEYESRCNRLRQDRD